MKKNSNFLLVLILAIISYGPIFLINTPLWDDYVLTVSKHSELSVLFKNSGGYNIGIAHFYHFLNLINGDYVFYSRIISFVGLVSLPILFYVVMDKLNISNIHKIIVSSAFILLPFFGSCFTQIVIPYIICFNLFLLAIIFLIKYIIDNQVKQAVLFFLFITFSYVTNSFIFFIIPVFLLVWILMNEKIVINKQFVFLGSLILVSIILFMLFKHFFMKINPNSNYENYNKITVKGLLFSGPQKAILQMPQMFLNLFYLTLDVLRQQVNLLFALVLAIPFYFTFKRMEWKTISFKHFMLAIVASIILIFSALYPYAVVGKVNNNMYEYTSRFDMLLVVGVSIMITSMILFLFKNQYAGKIFLSFTFSILFICKLCIFINFYYHSSLQNSFCNSYLSKLDSTKSHVIHEQKKHTVNWRFYEIGGILRAQHMTENIFFVSGKSPLLVNDTINKILVHDKVIINHYSIKDFDINNYDYKTVELNYKEKLNILDFFKLFLGLQPLDFTVKESKNNID
jgi:hypothetical protein